VELTQQQLTFEQRVDDRISALLARVEGIRLARDIDRPVKFDRDGERHARRIAQQETQGAK
jgi:hypothetical protein